MIEKILEQLDEEKEIAYADFEEYCNEIDSELDAEYDDLFHRGLERAKKIVRQVAREYKEKSVVKDGWILVETELPPIKANLCKYDNQTITDDVFVLCKCHGFLLPDVAYYVHDKKRWERSDDGRKINVIKWMPIPPYQKGE